MTTDYLSDDLPHQVPHKAPKAIPRVYVRSALPPATLSSGCYGLRCSASTQMDLSNVSNRHHNEKLMASINGGTGHKDAPIGARVRGLMTTVDH